MRRFSRLRFKTNLACARTKATCILSKPRLAFCVRPRESANPGGVSGIADYPSLHDGPWVVIMCALNLPRGSLRGPSRLIPVRGSLVEVGAGRSDVLACLREKGRVAAGLWLCPGEAGGDDAAGLRGGHAERAPGHAEGGAVDDGLAAEGDGVGLGLYDFDGGVDGLGASGGLEAYLAGEPAGGIGCEPFDGDVDGGVVLAVEEVGGA
jgi:hypothetical protein